MARKAAWEDLADSDLGPYAKPRGMRWGRLFTGLLLIGAATFAGAYYFPLYRAQQRLGEQFRELSQRSASLSESANKAQSELKSVTAERDQLRAAQDKNEGAQKDLAAQQARVAATLSAKLDKAIKTGRVAVVADGGSLLVALDDALLFQPQKLDLTPAAGTLLCDIAKSGEAKALTVSAALAPNVPLPAALGKSFATPWSLSAARAAAVVEVLAGKCAFPVAQLTASASGDHAPFAARLASSKLPADRVVLTLSTH